jgi:hypothetical protein
MNWSDRELTAFLDELLPASRMAQLEQLLRTDAALRSRLAILIRNRDQGGNSVGEIWQRGRLSCPSRTELGGYLTATLSPEASGYIEFHLQTVGCRVCLANLNDLEEQSTGSEHVPGRRRKFFESSAGLLRGDSESGPFVTDRTGG